MPKVEEIILPQVISGDYDASPPFNSLAGIKRLNVFVGPNNSGKSRLLREVFIAGSNLLISTDDSDARHIRNRTRDAIESATELDHPSESLDAVRNSFMKTTIGFQPCGQHTLASQQVVTKLEELERKVQSEGNHRFAVNSPQRLTHTAIAESLGEIRRSVGALIRKSQPTPSQSNQVAPKAAFHGAHFIYVPTLRGMRLGIEDVEMRFAYFDRTWTDYFKDHEKQARPGNDDLKNARESKCGTSILTGLDFYDALTDRLLGSLQDRLFIRRYEDFLSRTFFQGDPVALIPRRKHDTVNIKVGNEKERPIQSLGDGMQQLIILTLPLFEHRDVPLFLFIEEPDLFLHPGFQRVLIDAILEEDERELCVFVTTHSSQFLDITVSTDNCAIFRCSKLPAKEDEIEHEPRFSVSNASAGDFELLRHIGVRPSSVMFANCTIWVEGITDRLYFGRYVKLLLEDKKLNFIENLHYAFVEYGGGNITHWSFLDDEGPDVERICAKLFLISDEDEGKDDRHRKLAEVLGDRFYKLPVRESENLLTPDVIRNVIYDYEGKEIPLNKFTQSDIVRPYLGRFIDNHVLPDKTQSKRFRQLETCYQDKSGTVKDKVDFCRRAIKHIKGLQDMSEHAIGLAQSICDFIESENA